MKYQALFSSKDKSKKLKCRLLQFLFSASISMSIEVYGYLQTNTLVIGWITVRQSNKTMSAASIGDSFGNKFPSSYARRKIEKDLFARRSI